MPNNEGKGTRMKRKFCLGKARVNALSLFGCGILSAAILLTIGCGSRQQVTVKSEGLPSDQERVEATAVPEEGQSGVGKKKKIDPFSSEGQFSESPLPGDRISKDKAPPPVTEALRDGPQPPDKIVEPFDLTEVAPVPLIEEEADLSKLPRTLTDIFFDYDQYRIRQDAFTILETNAKILIGRYPDKTVIIQGHCDERGTQDYNLILGERRAMAVKKYLVDLGVPEKNMQVISYGKEKPFCIEHSKKCWQQNRRSHFVIH